MKVIGTAGHIDHGKSALVQALTGIDPDRLDEEKRRGMTIDLGFAWLTLPSGAVASVVDVPGHEKFVRNMLAGVGGIDLALLVVAADESVMPQTREHVDILNLLEVRHGVVALTKCDLVDGDWIELVTSDVADLLRSTGLEGSPVVPVSAVSGAGIGALREALDAGLRRTPPRRDLALPLVPIDRVFTIGGFGTVVTGTLQDGRLSAGAEVEVVPRGRYARIRGLQTHRRRVQESAPGDRVAVNLAGVAPDEIARGDALASRGSVHGVRRFDARLTVVAGAPFPVVDGMWVTLHVGAAERRAALTLVGDRQLDPGETGWASLRITKPAPIVTGQHFIVRLPSPGRTVAGGKVVHTGPPVRPRSERVEILEGLGSGEVALRVSAWLRAARVATVQSASVQLRIAPDEARGALERAVEVGAAVRLRDEYMSIREWESLRLRARTALERFHEEWPLKRGMAKEELRTRLHQSPHRGKLVLEALAAEGLILEAGALVASPTHHGGIADRRAEADRVIEVLRERGLRPPWADELCAEAGCDREVLAALTEAGEVIRVTEDLYFAREVFDRFSHDILCLIDDRGPVTVAEVRDHFGISRKYALALLEHLDALRVTRRTGDNRARGSRAPASV